MDSIALKEPAPAIINIEAAAASLASRIDEAFMAVCRSNLHD